MELKCTFFRIVCNQVWNMWLSRQEGYPDKILYVHKNIICCGYSLGMPQWGISNIIHNKFSCSNYYLLKLLRSISGLPLSGRTTYITPWDCHRTSKLNFKDVPRTSEISFVRPKSIPETSKNCQKARPLLTSCMMFAPPTYRIFATCVDWALRTSHFPLAGVYWQPCQASQHPFDGCVITACICHACWVD